MSDCNLDGSYHDFNVDARDWHAKNNRVTVFSTGSSEIMAYFKAYSLRPTNSREEFHDYSANITSNSATLISSYGKAQRFTGGQLKLRCADGLQLTLDYYNNHLTVEQTDSRWWGKIVVRPGYFYVEDSDGDVLRLILMQKAFYIKLSTEK